MNKYWETKRLGEIIKLEYGKPLPDSKRRPDGCHPVYGANGEKNRTNEYYYDKPSIIVGRKGSAGEINLTEEKFWPLDVTYFVKFDHKNHDLFFIYFLLNSLELPKLAKGVKPGINRNEVYSIEVKIPRLSEQKRIVTTLNEAFSAINKAKEAAEQNLKNASEVFESYLRSVFSNPGNGWKEIKLKEAFDFKNGRCFKKNEWKKSGIPIIRIQNLNNENASFNYYQGEYNKDIEISKGDLLFSWSGTIGSSFGPHIWNKNLGLLNQHIFKIIFKENINNLFAYYYFYFITSEIEKKVNGAVGLVHITKEKLNKFEMFLPDFHLQNQIVKKLELLSTETKKLEAIYLKKLTDLEELKKSILQQAFNGELTRKQ